jgi:hypothetical protein
MNPKIKAGYIFSGSFLVTGMFLTRIGKTVIKSGIGEMLSTNVEYTFAYYFGLICVIVGLVGMIKVTILAFRKNQE